MVAHLVRRAQSILSVVWNPANARTLRQKFVSGSVWSLASSGFSGGTGVITSVLIARMLGPADFGELGLVRSTILTLGVLSGYGLGLTATKHIAELRYTNPSRAGRIISMTTAAAGVTSCLAALVLWFGAAPISSYLHLGVGGVKDLHLAAPMLIANALWRVLQGALMGFQAFRELAINNLIYGVALIASSVSLTHYIGLSGAVTALSISAVIGAVLAGRVLLHLCRADSIPLRQRWTRGDSAVLFNFSLPAYVSGVLVTPVTWWSYAQVAAQPNGAAQMGLFTAADQWRTLILFVPQSVAALVLPMLSEAFGGQDKARYRAVLLSNISITLFITVASALGITVFSPVIIAAYGTGFAGAQAVLLLLAFTAIPQSLSSVAGQIIASLSKMWVGVFVNGAWAIAVAVGLILLFVPTAAGLAASFLFAYVLLLLLSVGYLVTAQKGALGLSFRKP